MRRWGSRQEQSLPTTGTPCCARLTRSHWKLAEPILACPIKLNSKEHIQKYAFRLETLASSFLGKCWLNSRVPLRCLRPILLLQRWKVISQSLALTEQQSKSIISLWHDFHSKVTELLEERKQIHLGLKRTSHAGCCGQEFAKEYLQVRFPVSVSALLLLNQDGSFSGLCRKQPPCQQECWNYHALSICSVLLYVSAVRVCVTSIVSWKVSNMWYIYAGARAHGKSEEKSACRACPDPWIHRYLLPVGKIRRIQFVSDVCVLYTMIIVGPWCQCVYMLLLVQGLRQITRP